LGLQSDPVGELRRPANRVGLAGTAFSMTSSPNPCPPFDFIPGIETLQWSLVPSNDLFRVLSEIETTFPVHKGQFSEIIDLMRPDEVCDRDGREVRFTWFRGDMRQSLHFLAYTPGEHGLGIDFVYSTESEGKLISCFSGMADSLWCHPALGDFAARLVLSEDLPVKATATAVLLVICRRGQGDDTGYTFRAHTAWVG
jgi:hypothetical protein